MIPLAPLLALMFATCPDLSGRYIIPGEDGGVILTIRQTRCATLKSDWHIQSYDADEHHAHTYALDGKAHPGGLPWEGIGSPTRAKFIGDTLEIAVTGRNGVRRQSFHLLLNKDLCAATRETETSAWAGMLAARLIDSTQRTMDAAQKRHEAAMMTSCR